MTISERQRVSTTSLFHLPFLPVQAGFAFFYFTDSAIKNELRTAYQVVVLMDNLRPFRYGTKKE